MSNAGKEMAITQQKYNKDFDEKVWPLKETIEQRRFVFVRKEF